MACMTCNFDTFTHFICQDGVACDCNRDTTVFWGVSLDNGHAAVHCHNTR
jgi:hypothetical protein